MHHPLIADKGGNPKGFAYIEFLEADAVANACLLDGSELRNRAIKVGAGRLAAGCWVLDAVCSLPSWLHLSSSSAVASHAHLPTFPLPAIPLYPLPQVSPKRTNVPGMKQGRGGRGGRGRGRGGFYPPYGMMPMMPPMMFGYGYPPYGGGGGRGRGRGGRGGGGFYAPY